MRDNDYGSPFGEVLGRYPERIKCNEATKVILNNLLCTAARDQDSPVNYYRTNGNGDFDLYLMSTIPTLDKFKELIKMKLKQSAGDSVEEGDLQEMVNNIYDHHVNYKNLYNELVESHSTYHELTCEGYPSDEIITDTDYACFEEGEETQLTFSYHSKFPDVHDKVFGRLPKFVQDQNSYGFSVGGELGQVSKNFPIYLKNHEEISIPLAKDCHEVKIIIENNNISTLQLPSIVGKGPLPEDCKKTNECVVHWCGEQTFSLQAESNDEIQIEIRFDLRDSAVDSFCLSKMAMSGCEESISWPFEAQPSVKSSLKTRTSIKLSKSNDESVFNHCFQFPFHYNFENYLIRRRDDQNSAVDQFNTVNFLPPANVQVRAFLEILDIAHDVGGALAIYRKEAPETSPTYEAQVCNPEMNSYDSMNMTVFRDEQYKVSIATVSDSGTFVAAVAGSQLLLYKLDMVTNVFSAVSAPESVNVNGIQSIALTTHGHFIALLMRDGNVQLLQKHTLHNTYDEYDLDEWNEPSYEPNEISIHASDSGVISLQVRNSNTNDDWTKEVSISSAFSFFHILF